MINNIKILMENTFDSSDSSDLITDSITPPELDKVIYPDRYRNIINKLENNEKLKLLVVSPDYKGTYAYPDVETSYFNKDKFECHTRFITNKDIPEILELCINLKLTFADLIFEVLNNNNPNYQLLQNDNVIINGAEYNLIQDGQKGIVGGLQQLNTLGQVNWNTQNIINFLCNNPQITTIYFTRQPTGIWAEQWNLIINHNCMAGRLTTNLFTPSGLSLKGKPRMNALLKHWVHNSEPNFGKLKKS
jgi:hypothetical protein